ncbi:MAG: 50S ribosomal protein L18e [Candidatus Diapherotrites archaeon]|nr:50S ribosomal protein L18e [Candidatus Diapherotrites archaeon]
MKMKTTNQGRRDLLVSLEKQSKKEKKQVWTSVAENLNKPKRSKVSVNLWKLNKFSKAGDTIIVPGKVLGYGELDHSITVAAERFSGNAEKKIQDNKGKAVSIEELMKSNPSGKGVLLLK